MLLSPDQTGFPLVVVPEAEVEIQLLPVTKIQFAQFIQAEPAAKTTGYRQLLSLNPPVRDFSAIAPEKIFLTGVLPQEAQAFARWMGEGFDLPTLDEWRAIYMVFARQRFFAGEQLLEWASEPARTILARLIQPQPPRSWLDLSLMRGGLVEWVRRGDDWLGLGAPRPEFQPNLWDPLRDPIHPTDPHERLAYFGFRLVRRGEWAVANKPGGIYLF